LGWLVIALLVTVLYAAGAPILFGEIETLCSGPPCPYFHVDAAMAESLSRLGLSPHSFVLIVVTFDPLPLLVCLVVSGMIVWKRPDDRMAVFAAFTLLTFVGMVLQSSIAMAD
jgi:hypothetical protein